jgi:hypothetical protein
VGVGVLLTGIGNEVGLPSTIGLGHPPELLSNPLRLKTTFMHRSAASFAYHAFER